MSCLLGLFLMVSNNVLLDLLQGCVGQTDSGLDHLWTNTPGKMSQIYAQYKGSDHKMIMGVRYTKLIKNKTRYVKKRSYKNFDEAKFIKRIKDTSWWDIYLATDVNDAVRLLTDKINIILDEMAPIKTFQTTTKYCPWLSKETKEIISQRKKAQEVLSKNRTEDNLKIFKTLRNKASSSLKKDIFQWQRKILEDCNNDSG